MKINCSCGQCVAYLLGYEHGSSEGQSELCEAVLKLNDAFILGDKDRARVREEAVALVEKIRRLRPNDER